jgi:hypothetical protein
MKNLVEEARTCHGEHTTHGKFIQRLADRIEELEAAFNNLHREYNSRGDRIAGLEKRLAKAVGALRFYAEGEWPEDYPGGVLYAAGDDADGFKSHLDYGDKARTTLAELEAKP